MPLLPVTNLHITTISGGPTLTGYVPNPGTSTIVFTFTLHDPDAGPPTHTTAKFYVNVSHTPSAPFTETIWQGCATVGATLTIIIDISGATGWEYFQVYHTYCDGSGYAGLVDIGVPTPGTFCQYGTGPLSGVSGTIAVNSSVITDVVAATGVAGWVAAAFTSLIGMPLVTNSLCSGPPPAFIPWVTSDFISGTNVPSPNAFAKTWNNFQALAWFYFCHCNPAPPGSTAPTSPPIPDPGPAPVGALPGPVEFTCDNEDLCSFLNQMLTVVQEVLTEVRFLRTDVTLIQRQHVPFAYVPGPVFTGLTGAGSITVSDILAFSVQCTTVPSSLPRRPTVPTIYYGLGRVAWGTADGWSQGREVSHNPALYLDLDGDVTQIGYWLFEGVVANIQTYVREP